MVTMQNSWHNIVIVVCLVVGVCACDKGVAPMDPNFSAYPITPLTITDEGDLIGGPMAQGRVGDVLLANERIRVIIQKPRKNAGVNSFGGNIIDADLNRSGAGQDNFGSLFPLVNIEWTVNTYDYEVISDGSDGSAKVLRAKGRIDVYDYLDLDFIGDVAEGVAGQAITFSNRFDDLKNPFDIYGDLKAMSAEVITDYILEPGARGVRIETTFTNEGSDSVEIPMGTFLNGSGQVSMLVPGLGFSPDLMTQVGANTPAVIYAGFDEVDVSYGYFFDPQQFLDPDTGKPHTTTSVSYSDVTGVIFGEEFLKLAPLGSGGEPDIHFSIAPSSSRTITSYFVVGDGSAGSVLDEGLRLLGAARRPISGSVVDASGTPVQGATVAIMDGAAAVITYRTDAQGRFSGDLPTGGDVISRGFGSGRYSVVVDKFGYHLNGTTDAGSCDPATIDLSTRESASITCTLGERGSLMLSGPVIDAETGGAIPARLTIVGEDPSPNKVGSAGRFRSTIHWEERFGIVDVKYLTARGTFDLTGSATLTLEPGTYRIVVSHGPEYTSDERVVEVPAGGQAVLDGLQLRRAARTPGYVCADFHVHSITSPDSKLNHELRVLSAAAEGLDVLQSSDHDYLTDYAPVLARLEDRGLIPPGSMQTSVGDEVTPNHYGHLHVFPLDHDPSDPEGGAFDWSGSNAEEVSPAPDFVWTLDEMIPQLREDPGEEVIMLNHIMDNPTGLLLATGWVTTPFYQEGFGVAPLSTYADPLSRRMPAASGGIPSSFGSSGLMTTDYNAVELVIGMHLHDTEMLYRSAIPTWFNLLNLGQIVAATADSDSHRGAANPMGLPRNFIAHSVDPRDGMGGSHDAIGLEEYARNINALRVSVSAGPVVMVRAVGADGDSAEIGGTVSGSKATFTVEVSAPSWGWFDTIEIYANTEPIPVDDATDMPMQGTAADPAEFYKPYHTPRYTYQPERSFKLSDGTLENWTEEEGVITASVTFEMNVAEDTWVVAMARGTPSTEGYRSLFPIVTYALVDAKDAPEIFDPADLTAFHADPRVGASAWGLANPIFIDADGGGFAAKYVREGISPL